MVSFAGASGQANPFALKHCGTPAGSRNDVEPPK